MRKNTKGITLVALVITIIILLILAGITISQLTGSGLFENSKLAEQKSKEAQEKEEGVLSDYENEIGKYVDGTRDTNAVVKNLLDKEEIFDTLTGSWKTVGKTITLNDSIENYDEICFAVSILNSTNGKYSSFGGEEHFITKHIKYNNSETIDTESQICITQTFLHSATTTHSYIMYGWFKNERDFYIMQTACSFDEFTKIKIEAIYGIKY